MADRSKEEWGPVDTDESPPGLWWNALNGERSVMHGGSTGEWSRTDVSLDWVIGGGESGPGARPMHPAWVRSLRDQCAASGVPFFFKQWGEWLAGEANRGQFDDKPMNVYRRCDTLQYEWPTGVHEVQNFGSHPDRFSGAWHARRIGKTAAGRMLDGREHDDMPEVRP